MAKRKNVKVRKKAVHGVISTPKEKIQKIKEPLSLKSKLIIGGLLSVLAMTLYAPSRDYDFVYDDDAVILNNRFVHKGLDGLQDIWTTSYFRGYNEHMNVNAFRPVPLTTM